MKRIYVGIGIVVIIISVTWLILFKSNTNFEKATIRLNIPDNATFTQVVDSLNRHHILGSTRTFIWASRLAKYNKHIRPGSYLIRKGMSNAAIVRLLKSGKQTPVNLVIIKIRTLPQLSAFLGKSFEADSQDFMHVFNDSMLLAQYGTDSRHVIALFMPNTYNIYWTLPAEGILKRMAANHNRFWNKERQAYCDSINLTPQQVETLASIVDEETNHADEKPILAGIYINRLHKGMKLEADPTARFGFGDFTIKKVLNAHINYDSPYNTYKYKGLPPGPICTPSTEDIDAVLHYTHSNYLYFCARPGGTGYSNYAATYEEHLRNAHAYQQYERMLHP